VAAYRAVKTIGLGSSAGQVAWTKVGWTGDFSQAVGTEMRDVYPNSRKYQSLLQFSVGRYDPLNTLRSGEDMPAIIQFTFDSAGNASGNPKAKP
jgi:hypothetical protein